MNQKKKIKLIATIAILIIILIMITCACINNLKKNKLKKNDINALSNGDITTIDITGITPAPESEHEHIYKTHYDDTKHWEECTVCGTKRNEQTHSFTTTWSAGTESCKYPNMYTKTCVCGYSYNGYKPCVWDGKTYIRGGWANHNLYCSVCKSAIWNTYYLYGSEELYDAHHTTSYEELNHEWCYKSDGSKITCMNPGVCKICKLTYGTGNHKLISRNNKIYCEMCGNEYGTCNENITRDTGTPGTYTIISNISLYNGATFKQKGGVRQIGNVFSTSEQIIVNGNTGSQNISLKDTVKFRTDFKIPYDTYITCMMSINNVDCTFRTDWNKLYPDTVKPSISNIQLSGNEWTKSKSIIISGTENWTNTVNIKIENDRGRVVYEGDANVTNNNWSISCTPEIEAGEESRVFTVTVTDACENSTTKNFEVSKVDGRPPTVTSSDKVTDSEWAREKSFTFTAEDLGIGNVEIGFNDVADYSPAVKDGNNYSKEYKFVGDAYSPVKGSVYFKDGLGNITTQLVTLEKIDNTAPTITNAVLNNNVVTVTAHDRHSTLGEGSGVIKYRYITSQRKLENPQITENNSQEIEKNIELKIPNISQIKYIYIVAEDLVGNISESYEIEVPQLELRSEVNQEGANGKGTVLLDWTGYDITNKYFVIYRKQEGETEWKTIVGIDAKMNNNTYTDLLGNDIAKPTLPEITIEKNAEAGQIKINQAVTDNGATYTYYIEAYDQNTNELISKSNTN